MERRVWPAPGAIGLASALAVAVPLALVAVLAAGCSRRPAGQASGGDSSAATMDTTARAETTAAPVAAAPSTAAPQGRRVTLEHGLEIQDVVVGTGREARAGDNISVQYTGRFTDGTKFDSSIDHGQPYQFTLGQGRVIKGWDQGIAGMKVGGKRMLTIPPALAYGAKGYPGAIPPNATLVFDVELVSIK